VTYSSATDIMGPLRRIKDAEELGIMHRAGEITEAAYQATLPKLRHVMTALDLITEVNYQLKRHGSYAPSFTTSFYNIGKDFPFDFHNYDEVLLLPLNPPVSVSFDFGVRIDGLLLRLRALGFFRRAGSRIPARLRTGHGITGSRDSCAEAGHPV
jgi:hypothetical protein